MKNLKKIGNVLNKVELKEIFGGGPPTGFCVDSNIECLYIGNDACPRGQGCFLDGDVIPEAYCKCL